MNPGNQELHTSSALNTIKVNEIDFIPAESTILKGGTVSDAKGKIYIIAKINMCNYTFNNLDYNTYTQMKNLIITLNAEDPDNRLIEANNDDWYFTIYEK